MFETSYKWASPLKDHIPQIWLLSTHMLWNTAFTDSPSAWYYVLHADGSATGVLLFNSNGMDIILTEETLSFRAIGGILDFYFFGGPTPADVLEQYTRLIGRPKMPPYWSLGFHQCKWDLNSLQVATQISMWVSDRLKGLIVWMHIWRQHFVI